MHVRTSGWGRRRVAALVAAGLLTIGSAHVASAAVAAPTANTHAPAKPDPDDVVDDGTGGDEGEAPARPGQPAPTGAAAAPLTIDDAVDATREGLRRSAIGSGIRRLRMLDYILIGGVGALLLLSIVLLVLVAGLRSRIAALSGGAAPRTLAKDEEQLYGSQPLP